jgi:hypothetical protein
MTRRTPLTQVQRDNLNIGIYLAGRNYGAQLDQILQQALGFIPGGARTVEYYERRFRTAQAVGRDNLRERIPGYFTFNAMPFGRQYFYKVTWYTWTNQTTMRCQIVPMNLSDINSMRRLRDQDLETRKATARSVRAADDIQEERQAIARQDYRSLQNIQARMVEDESLGEILSGWFGLPYADIQQILPRLPEHTFHKMTLDFQRTAQKINALNSRLKEEQARIAGQLMGWVMLQTGLPNNAPQLAIQDAVARLNETP